MEAIAVLEQVSYQYPHSDRLALKDISLEIQQGEFLGLIGATGAGKTTLCLALNGVVPQFYGGRFFGSIYLTGLDTLENPISELSRHAGLVFEDPETQLIATSVENEIAFALENLGFSREEMLRRIPRALEAVRMDGMEHKHPAELSGGQKQRLAIASALAIQPELLVLDEPTSQLDPLGAQEVFATVRRLNRELGITIVMASHAAEEMAEYADRILLLTEGKITALGTPAEIYSQVDLLCASGLRVPQVAQMFFLMKQGGLNISRVPVRLEEGLHDLGAAIEHMPVVVEQPAQQPEMPNEKPLLSALNLHYRYADGTEALRDVSLDIHAGDYVVLAGQNGAGKSTLVKHFLNLLHPLSGSVFFEGIETRSMDSSTLAQRIGYVGQNPDNQIFNRTVYEEVSFALKNLGYSPAEVSERSLESIYAQGLQDVQGSHPLALPRGDRARVVIAAVLAMKPDVMILDEPTTGQDYRGACKILDVSRSLHQQGKTVIVITHHLYLMAEYARRVVVMGQGSILLDAPVRQAFHELPNLRDGCLIPPQAVFLAQTMSRLIKKKVPLLTPQEIAACFLSGVKRNTS